LPPVARKSSLATLQPPPAPVAKSALKLNPETIDFAKCCRQTIKKEVAVEKPHRPPIAVTNARVNWWLRQG